MKEPSIRRKLINLMQI